MVSALTRLFVYKNVQLETNIVGGVISTTTCTFSINTLPYQQSQWQRPAQRLASA